MKNTLFTVLAAILVVTAMLYGCQAYSPVAPAASATPSLKEASAKIEVIKVKATETETALKAAQGAPTLPEAKSEVSKAQISNGSVLEAAGVASEAVETAKPLVVAHEKNEAAALDENKSLKDADDAQTKLWLRICAVLIILAGAAGAYLLGQSGSFIRAGASAGIGLVVGLGCFWAAAHIAAIWTAFEVTLGLAVIGGLTALVLHYRKHMVANDEALWGIFHVAADKTVSGGKNLLNVASEDAQHVLKSEISDAAFAKIEPLLPVK